MKTAKNPVELVYKLIMNSGYGKSIMIAIETETKIFDDEERFNVFLSRNYNWIRCYEKFGYKVKVKVIKTTSYHFNIPHVESSILSMSKRIMNEMMTIAEDSGIFIYFQDTDSMHIPDSDIPMLSTIFKHRF